MVERRDKDEDFFSTKFSTFAKRRSDRRDPDPIGRRESFSRIQKMEKPKPLDSKATAAQRKERVKLVNAWRNRFPGTYDLTILGDQKAGGNYIDAAKSLLYQVKRAMGFRDLQSYTTQQHFRDGTQIRVASCFGLDRITIIPGRVRVEEIVGDENLYLVFYLKDNELKFKSCNASVFPGGPYSAEKDALTFLSQDPVLGFDIHWNYFGTTYAHSFECRPVYLNSTLYYIVGLPSPLYIHEVDGVPQKYSYFSDGAYKDTGGDVWEIEWYLCDPATAKFYFIMTGKDWFPGWIAPIGISDDQQYLYIHQPWGPSKVDIKQFVDEEFVTIKTVTLPTYFYWPMLIQGNGDFTFMQANRSTYGRTSFDWIPEIVNQCFPQGPSTPNNYWTNNADVVMTEDAGLWERMNLHTEVKETVWNELINFSYSGTWRSGGYSWPVPVNTSSTASFSEHIKQRHYYNQWNGAGLDPKFYEWDYEASGNQYLGRWFSYLSDLEWPPYGGYHNIYEYEETMTGNASLLNPDTSEILMTWQTTSYRKLYYRVVVQWDDEHHTTYHEAFQECTLEVNQICQPFGQTAMRVIDQPAKGVFPYCENNIQYLVFGQNKTISYVGNATMHWTPTEGYHIDSGGGSVTYENYPMEYQCPYEAKFETGVYDPTYGHYTQTFDAPSNSIFSVELDDAGAVAKLLAGPKIQEFGGDLTVEGGEYLYLNGVPLQESPSTPSPPVKLWNAIGVEGISLNDLMGVWFMPGIKNDPNYSMFQ